MTTSVAAQQCALETRKGGVSGCHEAFGYARLSGAQADQGRRDERSRGRGRICLHNDYSP